MIEIASGKQPLQINNPVIGASGAFGFAGEYSHLIDLSKLGALVTNPVTWKGRACWNVRRLACHLPRLPSRLMGKASLLESLFRSQWMAEVLHGMGQAPIGSCCSKASRAGLTTSISLLARRSWRWCMVRLRYALETFSAT